MQQPQAAAPLRAATLAAVAALALVACGGEAGDLLALEISGGFQPEAVRLTVTEDGRGTCDGGELRPIPGERLIEARDLERDLEGLARDGASFGAPSAADARSYVARTREGTVRWVEGAPDLPEVLPRAALLAQQLEEELC
jgi:hypothetical protein